MGLIKTLFFVIVDRGKGNTVLHQLEVLGGSGGTIFYGEGTSHTKQVKRSDAAPSRKEIVMVSAPSSLQGELHKLVQESFTIERKGHGIAFSVPFVEWTPSSKKRSSIKASHHCIFAIVNRGSGGECIKAARLAGARGGTVIHGHGAGVPVNYYFPLAIEPQKDVVMVLAASEEVSPIRESIYTALELGKPGNGFLFVLPVTQISGFLKRRVK
ncbi:MAG TPA: hypothetical protein GXZ38_00550 [Spirochaetales bacterium]|nr:hypothetical protein [Spirochaetales bacterium]